MPDLASPLGWTLLHSFWQGFLVWLALRLGVSRIPRPDVRAKLGLLGLALFVVLQAATFVVCLHGVSSSFWVDPRPLAINARGAISSTSTVVPTVGSLGQLVEHLDPWMPWLVGAWTAWTIYRLGACAHGVRRMHRLLEAADPIPEPLLGRLHRLADRIGVRAGAIRFVVATVTAGPGTVGWLRPFIFVPPAILLSMSPDQIESIVAHELAHVLRRDYLLAAIQFVIEGVYTCNPFVRWIVARLNNDAELACDRIAVRHVSDPATYASALHRVAEEAFEASRLVRAAAGGPIAARVRSILVPPAAERSASAWTTLGLAGACVAVLLAISTSTLASASAVRAEARFLATRSFPKAVDEILGYDGDLAAIRAAATRCLGVVPDDVERSITLLANAGRTASSSPAQFRNAYVTLDEVVAHSKDAQATATLERFLLHVLGADGRSFSSYRLQNLLYAPDTYARLNLSSRASRRLFNAERYENDRMGRLLESMGHLTDVMRTPARLDQTLRDLAVKTPDQSDLATIARADNDAGVADQFAEALRQSHDRRFEPFLTAMAQPLGSVGKSAVLPPGTKIIYLGPPKWTKTPTSP